MPKRKSLADALNGAANPNIPDTQGEREPIDTQKPEIAAPVEQKSTSRQTKNLTPAREGKKAIAGYFDPSASRQLREIALAEGKTLQGVLREALNDFFAKRGKPTIA